MSLVNVIYPANEKNARELWNRDLSGIGLTLAPGAFYTGSTVTATNQAVWDTLTGQCYTWEGTLPKTVPANSTPEDTGGIAPGAWVSVQGSTVGQVISNLKGTPYISATDYKTSSNTWSDAINAAIQAAKVSAVASRVVFVQASATKYFIKDVVSDGPVTILGAGKLNTTFCPLSDGDTCFKATAQFAQYKEFTIQSVTTNSLSTGISVEAALATVDNCSFAFLRYCVYCPGGKSAAELDFRHNRFAASQYGVVLGGGQINSRFLQNTFSDCKCGLFITENSSSVSTSIEGIKMQGDLFYACGDDTVLGTAGIEIVGCRWIWLTDVMVDLSQGVGLRGANTSYLRVTNGYYSSNHSASSSCVVLKGNSPECQFDGTMFSDSRAWGLELVKTADGSPARVRLNNALFQNNDIAAGQQGDIVVNSVTGVIADGCTFLSNKPTGIAVVDNVGGGSNITVRNSYLYGQVFLGGAACKLYQYDCPTHPNRQVGVLTIPNGANSVTTLNGIKSVVTGNGSAAVVVANAASAVVPLSAGVVGSNLQIVRTGTSGDLVVQYIAELAQ